MGYHMNLQELILVKIKDFCPIIQHKYLSLEILKVSVVEI